MSCKEHPIKIFETHIIESNLFDVIADAYLVSIGEDCKLKGVIAKYVFKNISKNIEKRLLKAAPLSKGECLLIKENNINMIFGMPFDYEVDQLTIAGVEMVIGRALEICDANKLGSIAIPAIAASHMPEYSQAINHIIHLGIHDYFFRNPESQISDIFLVNYNNNVFSPIEFEEENTKDDIIKCFDIDV